MRPFGWIRGKEGVVVDPNRKKIAQAYRDTFDTPQGKVALDDLLWSLDFFVEAKDDEMRVRQNAARAILNKLGIFNDMKSMEIVDNLLKIRTVLEEDI